MHETTRDSKRAILLTAPEGWEHRVETEMKAKRVAILLPCYNEAATIAKVVRDFKTYLPTASIYVFDNASTDGTAEAARRAGAEVFYEPKQGKGHVIASMFCDIEADYYVMADGDDTYPADKAKQLLWPVVSGQADMTVGARMSEYENRSFRPMHIFGNNLVRWLVNSIFSSNLTDILSGYRAFNRRVIERVPIVSSGFEVETELTVNSLYYQMKIVEVPVPYGERDEDNPSKLHTFRDGFRVVWKLFQLARSFKPLTFFGSCAVLFFLLGFAAGVPPIYGFVESGFTEVKRLPLAILASGLMLLSAGCLFTGVMLHAVNFRFKELHNVLVRKRH